MTVSDIKTIIEAVFTGALLIGGIFKTVTATIDAIKGKDNESKRVQIEKEKQDVDLTERLQKMSADLLDQMEQRCAIIQKRLDRSERSNVVLRQTGLTLISGIINSLRAREQRNGPNPDCVACQAGDRELLTEILKVKELFEKEIQ